MKLAYVKYRIIQVFPLEILMSNSPWDTLILGYPKHTMKHIFLKLTRI